MLEARHGQAGTQALRVPSVSPLPLGCLRGLGGEETGWSSVEGSGFKFPGTGLLGLVAGTSPQPGTLQGPHAAALGL